MLIDRRLLSIIGRRFPAIYDVIPRGPLGRLSWVALNPQPLPPAELGAALAAEFIHSAWLGERSGGDQSIALRALDDWCPTYPRRPKLPPWWPPVPDPDPQPDWFAEFHLGFAARLAAVPADVASGRLREAFDKAIERSLTSLESALGDSPDRPPR